MARILQISDIHMTPHGALAYGRVDVGAAIRAAVAKIGGLAESIGPIDAIMITGDLTDAGDEQSYAELVDALSPLSGPLLALPGNHDARGPMRAAFGLPGDPLAPIHFSTRVGNVAAIGLDVTIPGQAGGSFGDEAAAYLEEALAAAAGAPVLLGVHHPPFATGVAFMDAIGLCGADRLAAMVKGYAGPLRIVCGHVHRSIAGSCGGRTALIAPSTAHAVALDLGANAPANFAMEPPGALLHVWSDGFASHLVPLADYAGPFPFRS